jgi:molecular chaperone DnaK (HSP70)
MPYVLGIDIGSTYTTAAVSRLRDGTWARPDVVQLDAQAPAVPSVLHLSANGSFAVGEPAARRGGPDGAQIARGFSRRIGDDVPLMVGGEPCTPQTLTAVLVMWVVELVAAREGGYSESIVLSHPAGWGPYRRDVLRQALWEIGLANVTLLPEPVTVAESHAARGFGGDTAAVYSLGGNSFEASLVRRGRRAGFEPFGFPQGLEPMGGADFDEALAAHVRATLGKELDHAADSRVQFAQLGLPGECARAKHELTVATETDVVVSLPQGAARVPVTRAEFEEMIRPALRVTVDMLVRTVRSAGLAPAQLDAVLLTGGSARIPLIAELLAAHFPGPLQVEADPQVTAATGAALAACQIVSPPRPRPRRPEPRRPDAALPQGGRAGGVPAIGRGPAGGAPAIGRGPEQPAARSDRRPERYEDEQVEPPPRPPVRTTPLDLPSPRGSRLMPGRGRGRGRG